MAALADLDHFGGVNEMILRTLAVVKAGRFGLVNDLLEITVGRILYTQ